jgi:ABC-2 type transport system ATP-binding protein
VNRRYLIATALTLALAAAPTLAEDKSIVVASTTSTQDSGLFGDILPLFKHKTGIDVKIVAQGTGQALDIRVDGDAGRFLPALAALPFAPNAMTEGGRLKVMLAEDSQAPDVLACLVNAGARVHSAVPSHRPLEEVYLELIRQGRV